MLFPSKVLIGRRFARVHCVKKSSGQQNAAPDSCDKARSIWHLDYDQHYLWQSGIGTMAGVGDQLFEKRSAPGSSPYVDNVQGYVWQYKAVVQNYSKTNP